MKQAIILDGQQMAQELNNQLKTKISTVKKSLMPTLATIIVGDNEASHIYVANKNKQANNLGIQTKAFYLTSDTSENELLKLITKLNQDESVHGILVQLPLPKSINEQTIIEAIDANKDVDGFHPKNLGLLMLNKPNTVACTPLACLHLIKQTNCQISGANIVIIGRSNIVGKPLAALLANLDATVTICHAKTKNLKAHTLSADILIVAIGNPRFIDESYVKERAVVIDVGINRLANKTICGDVDFAKVVNKASFITPVPKGVGPLTIAMLLQNTWNNYTKQLKL